MNLLNPRDSTRLTTVDGDGRRLWVYPSDVLGLFRTLRHWVSGILLVVFVVLPWISIGGQQAMLVDVVQGRFAFFGIQFWSHDAPMLLFVFGGAAILLAFVTSIWGRVWCGWACPQTVFVDMVFRKIERWIEGDALTRRRLDASPLDRKKALKKTLKWFGYLLVSLVLSHSFLAYFVGTESLAHMMARSPVENGGIFLAMSAMTALILFDFGWLREQFCTLLCPYGRFQSVLMDEHSLAVAYQRDRGEPRRGTSSHVGDCIDCGKCVHVCPTGIDIRNGLQLECIACTACIDACDTVMKKIKKPLGLIKYASTKRKGFRSYLRPAVYLGILISLGGALAWAVNTRRPLEITFVRAIGTPFQEIIRVDAEKEIVNHFKMDLQNQSFDALQFGIASEIDSSLKGFQFVSAALPLEIAPGEARRIDLFVRFPFSAIREGSRKVRVPLFINSVAWKSPLTQFEEVPLVGPLR